MEKRSNTSRQKRPAAKQGGSTAKRILLGFGLIVLVMVTGIGCGFLTASMNTKPDLANDILPPASSQIYDINGNEIANVHAAENRRPVKITQVPKELQNAFVAVEDNRFYEHSGVDPRGIIRALYANIRGRGVSEGGSTITQQLAKNAYLTQERTLARKVQEVFLALAAGAPVYQAGNPGDVPEPDLFWSGCLWCARQRHRLISAKMSKT
jgi:penicillin-binding protein 1A